MSDDIIKTGREANFAINTGLGLGLTEAHNAILAVYVGALAADDRERVGFLHGILATMGANIESVQYNLDLFDQEDSDVTFVPFEPERVTVEDENGGKHGVVGYTITVQNFGSEHVDHAGIVTDIFSNTTRLYATVEEARKAVAEIIFDPNSTVHISEVYTIEDIETVLQ